MLLKSNSPLDLTLHTVCYTQLPVKIDIIKHPNETDGKSTAIHAKILAPSDITIYTYPCIPEYQKDKVSSFFILVVVFFILKEWSLFNCKNMLSALCGFS